MKKKSNTFYTMISILSVLVFLLIWELLTDVLKVVPSYSLPSPIKVVQTFVVKLYSTVPDGGTLITHTGKSLAVVFSGFLIGTVIGVPVGIAMAWYRRFDYFFKPVFDILRPIPPVAWIPLALFAIGIGFMSKAIVIFISAVIPCIINSYSGIKQTSQVRIWVAQTFGAGRFEILCRVAIPTALPMMFTGVRTALSASWMTLVAAELLAANDGLGYMLQMGRMVGRTDIVMVSVITMGIIGALLSALLGCIEKHFVKGEALS